MLIDPQKFKDEIKLFYEKLAPLPHQQQAMRDAEAKGIALIREEAHKNKTSFERALLVGICGELDTKQHKAEFVTRLIFINTLVNSQDRNLVPAAISNKPKE